MERRAEVASIFNNRKTVIKGIEARNELFKDDFPREYQTWTETAKTDFESVHIFEGLIFVHALAVPGKLLPHSRMTKRRPVPAIIR